MSSSVPPVISKADLRFVNAELSCDSSNADAAFARMKEDVGVIVKTYKTLTYLDKQEFDREVSALWDLSQPMVDAFGNNRHRFVGHLFGVIPPEDTGVLLEENGPGAAASDSKPTGPSVVMEKARCDLLGYLEGYDGDDFLWSCMLPMAFQIARGLADIHSYHRINPETGTMEALIHRNLKPTSVLVFEDSVHGGLVLKLVGMGKAKFRSMCDDVDIMTKKVGRHFYRAPEVDGGVYGESADIFSMGMVICQMIAKFGFDLATEDVGKRAEMVYAVLRRLREKSFHAFADLLEKCVDVPPKERPTAVKFMDALGKEATLGCMPPIRYCPTNTLFSLPETYLYWIGGTNKNMEHCWSTAAFMYLQGKLNKRGLYKYKVSQQLANPAKFGVEIGSRKYQDWVKELKKEIMVTSRLNHENVVSFCGAIFRDKEKRAEPLGIILPPGSDCSLKQMLDSIDAAHPLTLNEFLGMSEDILRALTYLEDIKIVHCDVNPDNFVVGNTTSEGVRVKIFNFSQAQRLSNVLRFPCAGNLRYTAPEMKFEEAYDSRADVFSFGIMMADILVGKVASLAVSSDRMECVDCALKFIQDRLEAAFPESEEQLQWSVVQKILSGSCALDFDKRSFAVDLLKHVAEVGYPLDVSRLTAVDKTHLRSLVDLPTEFPTAIDPAVVDHKVAVGSTSACPEAAAPADTFPSMSAKTRVVFQLPAGAAWHDVCSDETPTVGDLAACKIFDDYENVKFTVPTLSMTPLHPEDPVSKLVLGCKGSIVYVTGELKSKIVP